MADIKIKFDASHSPTIMKFLRDKSDIKILKGPVGSGKTTAACYEVMRIAKAQEPSPKDGVRYTRPVILRNTYGELKMTTIKTWKEIFPEGFAGFGKIGMSPPIMQTIDIPGFLHCEVYFLALDQPKDIKKLLSLNISHLFFNELREFDEEIFHRAWDRVGRYPNRHADKHGVECTRPCMMGDTNPPDEDHWLYDLEHNNDTSLDVKFFNQPGAVIDVTNSTHLHQDVINADGHAFILNPEAENVPNLPTDYYRKKLPLNNRNGIRVYYESKYGIVGQGQPVCPNYDDDLMLLPDDFKPLAGVPIGIGVDIGGGTLSPACVIGQVDRWGTKIILAEVVCANMGLPEFCIQIHTTMAELFHGFKIEYGWGDPAGQQRDPIYETVMFDHMKTHGIPLRAAQTNDIAVRIEALNAPMKRFINKKPGFRIHRRCKVLRAGLGGKYIYKRLQVSGVARYSERPDKGKYSHPADALGYFNMGTGEFQAARGKQKQQTMRPGKFKTGFNPFA